jgi:hypothetical protein
MGPGPGNDASTGQTSGGGWPGTVARCQVQGAQWATQKHRAEERRTAAAAAATAITAAIEQAQTQTPTRTRTLACRLKRLGKRGLVAAASRRLGLRLRVCDLPWPRRHTPIRCNHAQPRLLPSPSPFGLCTYIHLRKLHPGKTCHCYHTLVLATPTASPCGKRARPVIPFNTRHTPAPTP